VPYSKTKNTPEQYRVLRNAACNRYNAKHRHKVRASARRYYEQNPEKFARWRSTEHRQAYMRQFRQNNKPEIKRYQEAWRLLNVFGITIQERDDIFARSGGLCAICGERKATHLDHCHKTGKLRGGLCHRCNAGIGMLDDNTETTLKAYEYLKRAEAQL
jgi:Autographiviridae endonuclease VII